MYDFEEIRVSGAQCLIQKLLIRPMTCTLPSENPRPGFTAIVLFFPSAWLPKQLHCRERWAWAVRFAALLQSQEEDSAPRSHRPLFFNDSLASTPEKHEPLHQDVPPVGPASAGLLGFSDEGEVHATAPNNNTIIPRFFTRSKIPNHKVNHEVFKF